MRGIVLSDIHMFSSRSAIATLDAEIDVALARADIAILNGDIFDFFSSTLDSRELTIERALDWLRDKLSRFAQCRFYFVLGNHDCVPLFVNQLHSLAASFSNLQIEPDFVILGDRLFIHGDIVHASGDLQRYRERFAGRGRKSVWADMLYNLAVWSGLSKLHAESIPRAKSAARIIDYLRTKAPEKLATVKHIYFGHTHAPFTDFVYEKWLFHNTGAMLRGLNYRILEFES